MQCFHEKSAKISKTIIETAIIKATTATTTPTSNDTTTPLWKTTSVSSSGIRCVYVFLTGFSESFTEYVLGTPYMTPYPLLISDMLCASSESVIGAASSETRLAPCVFSLMLVVLHSYKLGEYQGKVSILSQVGSYI